MSRVLPIAAAALFPMLLAGCENKPAAAPTTAAPAAATAAAPAAKTPTGGRPVGFELVSPAPVGALQFDVRYTGTGRFVGDADAVACESKVAEALSSYNHIVADRNLRLAFVAVKGFAPPVRIAECRFEGPATAADFTVTVRDASSPDLTPLDPLPTIKVTLD